MSDRPIAQTRVWRSDLGVLVAGVGQPIPDIDPALLVYDDPALAPPASAMSAQNASESATSGSGDPGAADDGTAARTASDADVSEPTPETAKQPTRVRTRRRTTAENR